MDIILGGPVWIYGCLRMEIIRLSRLFWSNFKLTKILWANQGYIVFARHRWGISSDTHIHDRYSDRVKFTDKQNHKKNPRLQALII